MASVTRTAVKPLGGGVGWELAGGEEWTPEAVTASWDGTGAGGNFVVAVSFYNDGGALIDRAFPEGVTNAPGDTGRTFFRPFNRAASGGGGTDPHAIHYDVNGDTGGFVNSFTTTGGYSWADVSGTGFDVDSGTVGTPGFTSMVTNSGQVFEEGALVIQRVSNRVEVQNQATQVRHRMFADGSSAQRLEAGAQLAVASIATGLVLVVLEDGQVGMPQLPIADPGISGRLWNNAGVVNVSP